MRPPIPFGHPTSTSDAQLILSLSNGVAEYSSISMPPNQPASSTAYNAPQSDFPDCPPRLVEPGFAIINSSFRTGEDAPLCTSGSMWNVPVGDINNSDCPSDLHPFPFPRPSESFVYENREISGYEDTGIGAQSVLNEGERQPSQCTTASALTGGRATPSQHEILWYLTCWNAIVINGPRRFIEQTIYQPQSQGDKERYVLHAKLHPPIIFLTQDSPEWGIPIQHLLSRQAIRLVEGTESAFTSCGPSVGIRLQWPGYPPCHKQIPTRDFTPKRRMINKAKLAKVVARCVTKFMEEMSKQVMKPGVDKRWKVGPSGITVNDIMLVSLHHVSQGSYQPQLRLRRAIGK